jgi:hypothetical protein
VENKPKSAFGACASMAILQTAKIYFFVSFPGGLMLDDRNKSVGMSVLAPGTRWALSIAGWVARQMASASYALTRRQCVYHAISD